LPNPPDVSIIIVSFNTAELTLSCIDRLLASAPDLNLQVIVIDNDSTDGSAEKLHARFAGHQQVELLRSASNLGFGRASNLALESARSEAVLLLNSDVLLVGGELSSALSYFKADAKIGVLGVRLVNEAGVQQPSARSFPTPMNVLANRLGPKWLPKGAKLVDDPLIDLNRSQECEWVPGCFYLTRLSLAKSIGLFDPRYFLYYEEVDHCKRVRAAGLLVKYFAQCTVLHLGGASAKSLGKLSSSSRQVLSMQVESELLYFRKHIGLFGVLAHLGLVVIADLVCIFKYVIKKVLGRSSELSRLQAGLYLGLFMRTAFASRPTR
jgi:N-acetylglucosaminyl-diphospho-decaprenol L-rhamnosyltransferase